MLGRALREERSGLVCHEGEGTHGNTVGRLQVTRVVIRHLNILVSSLEDNVDEAAIEDQSTS